MVKAFTSIHVSARQSVGRFLPVPLLPAAPPPPRSGGIAWTVRAPPPYWKLWYGIRGRREAEGEKKRGDETVKERMK